MHVCVLNVALSVKHIMAWLVDHVIEFLSGLEPGREGGMEGHIACVSVARIT